MQQSKIDLKRRRVIQYFIDATNEIAQKEGVDKVTIRNVSDLAGYNSATLYNYFENLDQLLAFSAISAITGYLEELKEVLENNDSSIKRYIRAWECYCKYSFDNPPIFTYVFRSPKTNHILSQIDNYLSIFPSKIDKFTDNAIQTVVGTNLETRDKALIAPCVKEGCFSEEKSDYINNFAYFLHQGIMYQLLTNKDSYTQEQAIKEFSIYFIPFINQNMLPGKEYINI